MGILLAVLIAALLVAYPFSRLLPHYGINPMWSLAAVTWIGALVLLWVIALRKPVARS